MDNAYTPEELENKLGEGLKRLRLQKNIDRQTLCDCAGVSMNALRHLETGAGATTKTLVRVVRALGRQDWLEAIAPSVTVNPLHMIRNKPERQRASGKRKAVNVRGQGKKAEK